MSCNDWITLKDEANNNYQDFGSGFVDSVTQNLTTNDKTEWEPRLEKDNNLFYS